MTRRFIIEVRQTVAVELDEAKFDDSFMQEFRESFFNLNTIEEHAEHIAQLQARGVIDLEVMPEFVEGYGPSQDMGIRARVVDADVEAVAS